jgi:hypothetical protein
MLYESASGSVPCCEVRVRYVSSRGKAYQSLINATILLICRQENVVPSTY